MKKLLSIALIGLLLLNVLGYYGVFLGIQYHNEVSLTSRLDLNQYEESQTVTLKIPISVPYMTDQADFERVDGLFEHNGEFYRLVKQKYAKDTLTIICFKDTKNKQIHNALTDYVKTFTDQSSDQNQNSKTTISFIKDYITQSFSLANESSGWQIDVFLNSASSNFIASFTPSILHPPERP